MQEGKRNRVSPNPLSAMTDGWKNPPSHYLDPMQTKHSTLVFTAQTPDDRRDAEARRAVSIERIKNETGIDDQMISALVEGFYERVRADSLIGPVFAARISDWEPHLAQMKLFWSSVALHSGVYQGRPMPKHLPLPIEARHFDRWLEIFETTAQEICGPVAATHFISRARRIAQSLELGIANANGVMLGHGERYIRPSESWTPESS